MSKFLLNSFFLILSFVSINSSTMAMEACLANENLKKGMTKTFTPEEAESFLNEVKSRIREGNLEQGFEMLNKNSPWNAKFWENCIEELCHAVNLDVIKLMNLESIQSFRNRVTSFIAAEYFYLSASVHIDHLILIEAMAVLLKEGDAGLARAHGILKKYEDEIIGNGEAINCLPPCLEKINSAQFVKLFQPLIERMVSKSIFQDEIMEAFFRRVLDLPYDSNEIWFENAAKYIEVLLKSTANSSYDGHEPNSLDDEDSLSIDSEWGIYEICLSLYRREEDFKVRSLLFQIKEVDLEDFPIFLRALTYRGVDKLEAETLSMIQLRLLKGYSADYNNEGSAEDFAKALEFEGTLNDLYKTADNEIRRKFEIMMKGIKTNH